MSEAQRRAISKTALELKQSKDKNYITKNATKFKREVTIPEFENRER